MAHTLKGVAGTIGATGPQSAAEKIELAVHTGDLREIDALLSSLGKEMSNVLPGLAAITEQEEVPGPHATKGNGSPEQLTAFLGQLLPHVRKCKPKQCKEILGEINDYSWPDRYMEELAALTTLVGRYRFKDAEKSLHILEEKLRGGI